MTWNDSSQKNAEKQRNQSRMSSQSTMCACTRFCGQHNFIQRHRTGTQKRADGSDRSQRETCTRGSQNRPKQFGRNQVARKHRWGTHAPVHSMNGLVKHPHGTAQALRCRGRNSTGERSTQASRNRKHGSDSEKGEARKPCLFG